MVTKLAQYSASDLVKIICNSEIGLSRDDNVLHDNEFVPGRVESCSKREDHVSLDWS